VLKAATPRDPYATPLAAAQEAGAVALNWGVFINAVVISLIVAFSVFMVVRSFNKLRWEEEEAPAQPGGSVHGGR